MSSVVRHTAPPRIGQQDRQRYLRLVRDQLKQRLPHVVGDAPILTGPADQRVAIPLPGGGLTLPQLVPGKTQERPTGMGQGPAGPGDVVARRPGPISGNGAGTGRGGGHVDHVVDLTIAEIHELMREDLRLPRLRPRPRADADASALVWNSRSRHGGLSQVDVKASLLGAIQRAAVTGQPPYLTDDVLRYHSWSERPRPKTSAVLYVLRDVSGSMSREKVYLSLAAANYVLAHLSATYPTMPVHLWAHHEDAMEVDEAEWKHLNSAGGTRIAPAYDAIRAHMDLHYPPDGWNRYLLHLSDGDVEDPEEARAALVAWMPALALAGIVLTQPIRQAPHIGLGRVMAGLGAPVRVVEIHTRTQIIEAMRTLLADDEEDEA